MKEYRGWCHVCDTTHTIWASFLSAGSTKIIDGQEHAVASCGKHDQAAIKAAYARRVTP